MKIKSFITSFENALARRFRDLAGNFNQAAAAAAVEVYWMVFGIPLKVK